MNLPRNRRILLIDDMPAIHEDFRKILAAPAAANDLGKAGAALFGEPPSVPPGDRFELDSAYQGQEGLAKVEAAVRAGLPYAMAFVDMLMPPGWDGVETIERLWHADPQLQVVICTAYSGHPWPEVLARLDVRDRLLIVKKPFDMIEVSQLASMLTAKWTLSRQAASQMSHLRQVVHDLQASEAALRQSQQELEAFAHSLSHDLRTPLGVVSLFSQLLTQELGGRTDAKARHYLARIEAGAATGEQLIEGLLSLTRIARAQLRIEPVDLGAMAHELLNASIGNDPQRQASVTVQDGLWANADARLIKFALRHLLGNAWKFTSRQAHARIEVGRLAGEDGEPVFFVRDNGCGFDMAHAGKLFHTFQRLHTAGEFPGVGVGMVAVSRTVARHGGRVWADAAVGAGATFYFTLAPALRSLRAERHAGVPTTRPAP